MNSFLSTFRISAPLTLHAIRLLTSWRTFKDAFAHNLPPSHLEPSPAKPHSQHLSWDFQRLPSTDIYPRILSQKHRSTSFGAPLPNGSLLPPSGFLTLSTAYSSRAFAGLLHPATSLGFATFRLPPKSPCQRLRRHTPRDANHTLQSFPLPCSRTLSPGPLPPRCQLPIPSLKPFAPTSRPYSANKSVASTKRCRLTSARCSLGLRSPPGLSLPNQLLAACRSKLRKRPPYAV